ncbi:tetratricopeptide repeat protein [Flammeovirga agarivorans]|uniref:Tetratricopeptide repeat protein n=1 Tax=Flammeovirga agarivorans TaxID=2726742 RepID=A0A7X8XWK4_9BACT|nr:tetratricopeptide repeat protein [Flammeovirga agarivorans]NLR92387.1 tetratricopeptide repeat protein [Flammeovirga agarivorans]
MITTEVYSSTHQSITYDENYLYPYLKVLLSPNENYPLPKVISESEYSENELIIRGLCEMKNTQYWSAFWDLKKAYHNSLKSLEENELDTLKRLNVGMISVALEVVPNEYHWLRNFLGFSPIDPKLSRDLISDAKKSKDRITKFQAYTSELLINTYFLKNYELANSLLIDYENNFKDSAIAQCAIAWVNYKLRKPKKTIYFLNKIDIKKNQWFGYYNYLKGSSYYYLTNFDSANVYFNKYLSKTEKDYTKDIYYKKLISYWLVNNTTDSVQYFKEMVINKGTALISVDKYAISFVKKDELPNADIMFSRILFDGGNYNESIKKLKGINIDSLNHLNQLEFYYRFGRAKQELNDTTFAINAYLKVLELGGSKPKEYYPANASLNLGHLYEGLNEDEQARFFYKKAISYPKHPYKNSIDSESKRRLKALTASN